MGNSDPESTTSALQVFRDRAVPGRDPEGELPLCATGADRLRQQFSRVMLMRAIRTGLLCFELLPIKWTPESFSFDIVCRSRIGCVKVPMGNLALRPSEAGGD